MFDVMKWEYLFWQGEVRDPSLTDELRGSSENSENRENVLLSSSPHTSLMLLWSK